MSAIIFVITLAAEVLTLIAVVISIALPQRRIWPPRRTHACGQYYMLTLFLASGAGVILLGVLDWDTFSIPSWVRVMIGVPFGLAGNALALWAIAALGMAPTSGDESALVYRGPYRFSRNPQYVGFILALIGWALITNSVMALIVSLAGIVPLLLVPLAEEPWLRDRLGAAYDDYQRTVPRFIGMKK